ncbi:hypothetical protein M6B38_266830 [Iris pallida]|uniref:Uncharacterized protein n=1 Tax=Iris pallida TaxID=29817 RepID=A0AAX6IAI2_IRIPA|nr:hypothetical protein M6B38_266830 [Iris pallida]
MGRSRGPSGPGGYDPALTYMPCLYSLKPNQWRLGSVEANRIQVPFLSCVPTSSGRLGGLIWFPLGFLQTTCTNGRTHPHSNQMAR